jgi:chaperonin GroES
MGTGAFIFWRKWPVNKTNKKNMKTKITMLHDRVLLKQDDAPEKTAGGIIIPEGSPHKEKPLRGKVVSAGKGINGVPISVKSGDHVMYTKHAGSPLLIEGVEYIMMKESDILVVL